MVLRLYLCHPQRRNFYHCACGTTPSDGCTLGGLRNGVRHYDCVGGFDAFDCSDACSVVVDETQPREAHALRAVWCWLYVSTVPPSIVMALFPEVSSDVEKHFNM